MKRRSVLAGAVATPVLLGVGLDEARAATATAVPAMPSLTLYDARLPVAERIAWHLHRQGAPTRPTGGEIAALLLRERLLAADGPILGFTGHAEYLLARDIARVAGRQAAPLMRLGLGQEWLGSPAQDGWRPLLAGLLQVAEPDPHGATTFAWVA
ncbi:hypothetical protein [Alteraurantiacibacter buctensis]|uniref:Uncharacterized protein n=1 Tax=Alteraurantiacibacter buctensis TaxID=1503981 RepID=A0A844Z0P9_9SPHN|nr:hypothetical protein [Alteraurantiacibacter buctensis]MXO72836.1 hypothetical protein [Alteraurantiacibacter buctensis]